MAKKSPIKEALKSAYSTAINLRERLLLAIATGSCTGMTLGALLPFLWEGVGVKGPSYSMLAGALCFASIQFCNLLFGRTLFSALAAYKSAVEYNTKLDAGADSAQIIQLNAAQI